VASTVFIRIDKAGDVESVGALPLKARRLDTGEEVDPRDWLRATGYYDVETVTLADMPAGLTAEQQQAAIDAVQAARVRLEVRRHWVEDTIQAWALAKDAGQDHLDGIPAPPPPSQVSASLIYLYDRVQQLTRWIVGGGTVMTPGLGDVLKITVEVVADLIEQANEVEPPA
jgi:hypothetical protein